MGSKFLTNITTIRIIALCTAGAVMFGVVIVGHQKSLALLLGFLNWPALGPLVSAAAVGAALYIAIVGWRKNTEDRRADFGTEQEQKKRETKDIASGTARILYMELEEASLGIIRFVQELCEDKNEPPAVNFDNLSGEDEQSILNQYAGMYMRAEWVMHGNVLKKEDFEQAISLFRFSAILGDKYIGALRKYRAFIVNISKHLQATIEITEKLYGTGEDALDRRINIRKRAFIDQPNIAKFHFYTQVKNAIDTLKLLEGFRVIIPTCPERDQTFDRWATVVEAELIRCGVFDKDTVKGNPMSNERYLSTLNSFRDFLREKVKKNEKEMTATLFNR